VKFGCPGRQPVTEESRHSVLVGGLPIRYGDSRILTEITLFPRILAATKSADRCAHRLQYLAVAGVGLMNSIVFFNVIVVLNTKREPHMDHYLSPIPSKTSDALFDSA
jgi:hypothetical protein